jgi:cobalt-zinc-cadmium efflux system protein
MAHSHHHENTWGNRLIITMIMNLIIPIVQIIGGIFAGSMALISDAVHNLSDFTSALISYIALRIGQRPPTPDQTFGYRRIEVLAAVLNVAILYGAAFFIAFEGWQRFTAPQPIHGSLVVWIALLGFAANMVAVVILHQGSKENVNIKSVFLHMLTDALTSLAVAALGIIWIYRPWYWLDPIVSWIIVAIIFYSGWDILKHAFNIFMNATPETLDVRKIRHSIMALKGIHEVHHMHVWSLAPGRIALSAHIVVPDQMLSSVDSIAISVRELLLIEFGIDHPVLQFETRKYEDAALYCNINL